MVNGNNIGVVVEPENKEVLTEAIKKIIHFDKENISHNAFNYAQKNFSIDNVISHFAKCLV